jgi:hypothetical protein
VAERARDVAPAVQEHLAAHTLLDAAAVAA